jgi:hypothetical protein
MKFKRRDARAVVTLAVVAALLILAYRGVRFVRADPPANVIVPASFSLHLDGEGYVCHLAGHLLTCRYAAPVHP